MSEIIYKTRIPLEEISDFMRFELPKDAEILTIQLQGSSPCLWYKFLKSNAERRELRIIEVFGTGQDFDSLEAGKRRYISTVLIHDGHLVLHFFERTL